MARKKTKATRVPGIDSEPVQEALRLFTLMSRKAQVEYIIESLTNKADSSFGISRRNYLKVAKDLNSWLALKDETPFEQIIPVATPAPEVVKPVVKEVPAKAVKEETPVQYTAPAEPVTVSKPRTWIDVVNADRRNNDTKVHFVTPPAKSSVASAPEVTLKVEPAPKGRGAAPSTATSLVIEPTVKTKKISKVAEPIKTVVANATIQKLADESLAKYKQMPLASSWPYIKIATLTTKANGKNTTEKVVVLGTSSGYENKGGDYFQIYCAVNGKVPSRRNTDDIYVDSNGKSYVVNYIIPGEAKALEDSRWIRIMKYEDGMLFRYWKHNKNTNTDVDRKYFQLVGTKVTEVTQSTYAALESGKTASGDYEIDI